MTVIDLKPAEAAFTGLKSSLSVLTDLVMGAPARVYALPLIRDPLPVGIEDEGEAGGKDVFRGGEGRMPVGIDGWQWEGPRSDPELRESLLTTERAPGWAGGWDSADVAAALMPGGAAGPPRAAEPGGAIPLYDLPVPVTRQEGPPAARRAASIYRQLIRQRNQAPRPDRLPGLVYVNGRETRQVINAVLAVNAAKASFGAAMAALTPRGPETSERQARRLRQELLQHSDLQHVILKAAARRIVVINEVVDQVSFSWSGASRDIRPISAIDLCAMLRARSHDGVSSWASYLEGYKSDVAFAMVRRKPPFVVCNLKINGEWAPAPRGPDTPGEAGNEEKVERTASGLRLTCSMPIVLTRGVPNDIRDLGDYTPGSEPGKKSSVQLEDQPLLMLHQIGIYRYKDGGDQALARLHKRTRAKVDAGLISR